MGGRHNIVKMSIISNLIYRFTAVSIKISARFFVDIDKPNRMFMWKCKRPRMAKIILKKKNKLKDPHYVISRLMTKLK